MNIFCALNTKFKIVQIFKLSGVPGELAIYLEATLVFTPL